MPQAPKKHLRSAVIQPAEVKAVHSEAASELEDLDLNTVSDTELGIDTSTISNEPKWQNYRVRSGDTLGRVFQKFKFVVSDYVQDVTG